MMAIAEHLSILRETFGCQQFRPIQEKVINRIIGGEDVLLILPTGGGKSLCYQFPALILPGTCIVISPLIALMQDQVRKLKLEGIAADMLDSNQTEEEYLYSLQQFKNNQLNLLYISPEQFNTTQFNNLIKSIDISFFAIDEAHCVSEWGHDFRSDYRELTKIKTISSKTPIIALTATANDKVTQDICEQLHIKPEGIFRQSVFRKNLFIEVEKKDKNHRKRLLQFIINQSGGQGIIYAQSRSKTEKLSAILNDNGIACLPYHAGLSVEDRNQAYRSFVQEEVQIVVATIAFGMGIDKNNIRFIVHTYLPKSLESYYQEIGRAGRDGLPSQTLLLFSDGDLVLHRRFADEIENEEYRQQSLKNLNIIKQYAYSENCRHQMISKYFSDQIEPCGNQCDACLSSESERIDVSEESKLFISAIYRANQSFGKNHIIDILLESKNKKILRNNHDKLSVYGRGKHLSKQKWEQVYNRLFDLQAITLGDYQVLKLLPFAKKILKDEHSVSIKPIYTPMASPLVQDQDSPDFNADCFEDLRKQRRELAQEHNLPAYCIFDDKTLREMASKIPHTESQFLQINGVGAVKNQRFGELFLTILRAYQQPDIPTENSSNSITQTQSEKENSLDKTYYTTLSYIQQGMNIEDIINESKMALITILDHVIKLHNEGLINSEKCQALFADISPPQEFFKWIEQGLQIASFEQLQSALLIYSHINQVKGKTLK
jgi:ATP-dependent DNA helicase RecQ